MKLLFLILLLLTILSQYALWWGQGSISSYFEAKENLVAQNAKMTALAARNNFLMAQVEDLKVGKEAIEELARVRLGMITEGEHFVQILEEKDAPLQSHDKNNPPSLQQEGQ
jgi:cell division protein FtsB